MPEAELVDGDGAGQQPRQHHGEQSRGRRVGDRTAKPSADRAVVVGQPQAIFGAALVNDLADQRSMGQPCFGDEHVQLVVHDRAGHRRPLLLERHPAPAMTLCQTRQAAERLAGNAHGDCTPTRGWHGAATTSPVVGLDTAAAG